MQSGSAYANHNLWTAKRASIDDDFINHRPLDEINGIATDSYAHISGDGLTIYYTSNSYGNTSPAYLNIYKATRQSQGDLFGNIQQIIFPTCNDIPDCPLHVGSDGKSLYYVEYPNNNGIYLIEKRGKTHWVNDDITSPCIAMGQPGLNASQEPTPNGCRINMGAYGRTAQASKSIKTDTNVADFNNDCVVDLLDFTIFMNNWLWSAYN